MYLDAMSAGAREQAVPEALAHVSERALVSLALAVIVRLAERVDGEARGALASAARPLRAYLY